MMSFFVELMWRAWQSVVASMGTTTLAVFVAFFVIPFALLLFKLARGGSKAVREHWRGNVSVAAVTAVVWIMLFSYHVIQTVPAQIRSEAASAHAPFLSMNLTVPSFAMNKTSAPRPMTSVAQTPSVAVAPSHWYDANGVERSLIGSEARATIGEQFQASQEMSKLQSEGRWNALRDAAEKQITLKPEWPTPYFVASIAYVRLCQKDLAINRLQMFVASARKLSRSTTTYDPVLRQADTNLGVLRSGSSPFKCE